MAETNETPSEEKKKPVPSLRALFVVLPSLLCPFVAAIAAMALATELWMVGLIYLAAINLATLVIYRVDKGIAIINGDNEEANYLRLPESLLLALACLGGTVGAFVAMYLVSPRHKNAKRQFYVPFWLIVVLQVAAAGGIFLWLQP